MPPKNTTKLPILPLRDAVVYPNMVIPLFVGRENSITALESALKTGKQVFLVAQKDQSIEHPAVDDLYKFGTIATVLQVLKLPDKRIG